MPDRKLSVIVGNGLANFLNWVPHIDMYETRIFEVQNNQEIMNAIDWGDYVWFEFCNEVAMAGTKYKNIIFKKVIVRLHSYEALNGMIDGVDWNSVHHLNFVAHHVKDVVAPEIDHSVIPNGVDLEKFEFLDRKKGYDIAFLANINHKKGVVLLPQIMAVLNEKDMKYKLHIAGAFQEPRFEIYLKHIVEDAGINVQFYGYIKDRNEFLKDKNYVLCTSPWESQNMGVMEAMACGVKPLVHNFLGAKEIFSERYIWNTIPELIKMIESDSYYSIEYREYIENYALDKQVEKIKALMRRVYDDE